MDTEKLKDLLITDLDTRIANKEKLNQYAYYIMIVLIAVLGIFVPPITVGSLSGDFTIAFPATIDAWIVWLIINGSSIIANISILVFFKLQAKKNCLKHPNYVKATEILDRIAKIRRVYIPRSPGRMNREDYTKKVFFITLFTLASFVAITNIILSFDLLSLISTLLSMIVTLILSWSCMLNNEEYWTSEYLMYAEYIQKEYESEKTEEGVKNA